MVNYKKNKILLLLLTIIIFILVFLFIALNPLNKDGISNNFPTELKEIRLQNSKVGNLYEVADLVGKSRKEIEEKFSFKKVLNKNEEEYAQFYIDNCVFVYFEDDLVSQVSTGADGTENCFEKNFNFDKDTRLSLFGETNEEKQFVGLPGFGEYNYISKGFIIIKNGKNIWQFWATSPMTLDTYKDLFINSNQFKINDFTYNPQYDFEGNLQPSTSEI